MDKEEFTRQILAMEKSMYHVAKSILRCDEDCADAMQNAILAAYSRRDDLRNQNYFKTWLTRILINECYGILRKKKEVVGLEEYSEFSGQAELTEAFSEVEAENGSEVFLELQRLGEKYRLPFILHYVEGYSAKEIGKLLQISEGNVKTRLYRARNILRERLKGVQI